MPSWCEIILEICANSLESALAADEAEADRIELCANLEAGGITPSYGTIKLVYHRTFRSLTILIRPRPGDHVYSDEEFEIMREDIKICKEIGIKAVTLGVLTNERRVDVDRTRILVEEAKPMTATFSRAFDEAGDLYQALEEIIAAGCHRVLTSGGQKSATEGQESIAKLVKQSDRRIKIMAGGGIRPHNVVDLVKATGVEEVHSSAISDTNEATIGGMFGANPRNTDLATAKELVDQLRTHFPFELDWSS